jgi:hypothetical protein
MLLLIIVLVLLFGGGGGYYGYSRWGSGGHRNPGNGPNHCGDHVPSRGIKNLNCNSAASQFRESLGLTGPVCVRLTRNHPT